MEPQDFRYDDVRRIAVATVNGRSVSFSGSRAAALRFFAKLARYEDVRGIMYSNMTPTTRGPR